MGVSLSNTEYANFLIGSLPTVYDSTISSITAAAKLTKKPIDSDDVIILGTDEYDRRDLKSRAKSKKDEKDAAFHAGVGSKGGKQGGRKDITCHNCLKRGHVKADCWAKGGGKEGQGPKGKKGGGSATSTTATASAVAATEGEGVWTIIDEDVFMEDWATDYSNKTNWSMLSDNSEGELDNSPPIPDTHPSDADHLHSIMLSREVANICLDDDDLYDNLPSLETVSDSTDDIQSQLDDELLRRPVHAERGGACDVWTEQVREPHLNNTHTHFKNLNTLSPTIRARCFEFGVLKVLRNTQMFYLVELTLLTCLRIFCV